MLADNKVWRKRMEIIFCYSKIYFGGKVVFLCLILIYRRKYTFFYTPQKSLYLFPFAARMSADSEIVTAMKDCAIHGIHCPMIFFDQAHTHPSGKNQRFCRSICLILPQI